MGIPHLNTEGILMKREHCIETPIFFQGTDLRQSYKAGGLNKEVVLLADFTVRIDQEMQCTMLDCCTAKTLKIKQSLRPSLKLKQSSRPNGQELYFNFKVVVGATISIVHCID